MEVASQVIFFLESHHLASSLLLNKDALALICSLHTILNINFVYFLPHPFIPSSPPSPHCTALGKLYEDSDHE